MIDFRKIQASDRLSPFVRQYWVFEITQEHIPYAELFFPYGSHELIFYISGKADMTYMGTAESLTQENGFYAGQFTHPYELKFNGPCTCMGVSFHPWVGNLLYKIPSDEFTNSMVKLNCLEKDSELFEQLCSAENNQERLTLLEKYLEEKLPTSDVDIVSAAIARQIIRCNERKELKKFLSTVGLSERRMQQRFLESTGLTMSSFLRKVRFQKSVLLLQEKNRDFNLTQLALLAGYYDQAHFINEFKEFAYKAPNEFAKQNSELKDFFKSVMPVNSNANTNPLYKSDSAEVLLIA